MLVLLAVSEELKQTHTIALNTLETKLKKRNEIRRTINIYHKVAKTSRRQMLTILYKPES